jgi:adenylyl-sulfate kinase
MAENLTPCSNHIPQEGRERINGHKGVVLWFNGLSGSGKSSIAGMLESILVERYQAHTCFLDGDSLRSSLNRDLGFSDAHRSENIRRMGEVARLMFEAGLITLVAFISPFARDRERARALVPAGRFWEIYVDCPLEICRTRDPKRLYLRAQHGEITDFTGISSVYEPPLHPELVLHSDRTGIVECAEQVLARMLEKGVL